nr:hypothetical protein [Tanacetum cinerariifolium]
MTTLSANNSVFMVFFKKQKLTGPNFIDWQEEGQSVSSYVLKMKGYIDNLERLGYPVTLGLGGLRASRKLKPGALSLYVGNGQREAVEAIGVFNLCLPSGLEIVLNNCHYAPSIIRGIISVFRLSDSKHIIGIKARSWQQDCVLILARQQGDNQRGLNNMQYNRVTKIEFSRFEDKMLGGGCLSVSSFSRWMVLQRTRRVELSEEQSISFFLAGLQNDVEVVVRMFKPRSSTELYRKQLIQKELEEKRTKNIYFYCDQKYVPGYKCQSWMFSLEVVVENDEEDIVWEPTNKDVDCELSDVNNVVQEENSVPHISLNALTGRNTFQTMRVNGYVGKHEIHILIDSGSTHNFLDSNTAKRIGCQLKSTYPLQVTVANGCEMMLGILWLSTLGNIICNFRDLKMSFQYNGRTIKLRGSQKVLNMVSAKPTTTDVPKGLQTLLEDYNDVFVVPKELPTVRSHDHIIPLKEGPHTVNIGPYRHPATQKDAIESMGYTQTPGIDYEETFSSVADIRAIRILIAIAAYYDYEIWQMDVKTAFLNGYLNEEVKLHIFLESRSTEIRSRRLIGLCQSAYIEKNLKRFCMENFTRGSIPMQEKLTLSKSQGASTPAELKRMQNVPYALAVGSILYAVRCTRPDVANTKDMFLVYECDLKRELRVSCYTDAGYLMDADDLKSHTGYVFVLNGGVVDWKSAKQSIFATSSAEAEYIVAFDAFKEVVWVRKFISGLSVILTIEEPISMYCDNTGATAIANESGITKGARHFCVKVHYLREVIEYGDIKLEKVHTDDNLAGPFTKALAFPKHSECTRNIEMLSASSLM